MTMTANTHAARLPVTRQALQWRLMVLWMVALLLPTLMLIIPLWRGLAAALDHSLYASQWAHQLDAIVIADVLNSLGDSGFAIGQAGVTALLLTLLLSPFLSGTVITAARASTRPGFAELIQGGVREYGRLLRMLLWSALPLGVAAGLGALGMHWAKDFGEKAILESDVQMVGRIALAVMIVLLLLAHLTVDAGRAQFALFRNRTSAIKAWWNGLKTLRQHFWRMLGSYVLLSAVGLGLALVITALRVALPQLGVGWTLIGLALAELAVATVVWMKIARLLALIQQSRH